MPNSRGPPPKARGASVCYPSVHAAISVCSAWWRGWRRQQQSWGRRVGVSGASHRHATGQGPWQPAALCTGKRTDMRTLTHMTMDSLLHTWSVTMAASQTGKGIVVFLYMSLNGGRMLYMSVKMPRKVIVVYIVYAGGTKGLKCYHVGRHNHTITVQLWSSCAHTCV